MRLIYAERNLEILLKENLINVICIEHPKVFSELLRELISQCAGDDGMWILSEGENALNISKKVECIVNPFSIDINDKRLIKVLYSEIKNDIDDCLVDKYLKSSSEIISFVDDVLDRQPYMLDMDTEIFVPDLLKLLNVKFEENYSSFLEQITVFIKLMHKVVKKDIFVFVNLKSYLSDDEILLLYECALYEKIRLVLIENKYIHCLAHEKVIIIDKDLCTIEL